MNPKGWKSEKWPVPIRQQEISHWMREGGRGVEKLASVGGVAELVEGAQRILSQISWAVG